MNIYTIGFTKRSARDFFGTLADAGVKRLIDVRLNNVSQLAGFSKKGDLAYFTEVILGVPYTHDLELAPTSDMLDEYRKLSHDWATYEGRFVDLLRQRRVETSHRASDFEDACLLCTEPTPHRCHRRLVAEYLRDSWPHDPMNITHL